MNTHRNPLKAQSGLEYLGIAVLIMLGVLIGGPYIVRSINSYFKNLEEGAINSHREKILQAPDSQQVQLPVCNCTWNFSACATGGILDNGKVCQVGQNIFRRQCLPLGCENAMIQNGVFSNMQECRDDPTNTHNCCTQRQDMECGNLGASTPGGACPDGQIKWVKNCGSPTPTPIYTCAANAKCVFNCATISPTAAGWCDSNLFDKNLMAQNQAVRYVDFGDCNVDSDMRCKAQCPAGFHWLVDGCAP